MTKAGGVEVEQSNISLEGKVCLITGGARGIGAAVARAVAAQGALVAINFLHSQKEAMKLVEELQQKGHKALALQADISREEEVSRLFGELRKAWGEVELLVNNAGVALRTLVQETTVSEWDRVMNVNLKGAFLCCREALPHMIRKRYGRIVNIASIQGISGASYESVYAASKGGLIAFTKSLASEVGPSGITVNAIAPGPVATEMIFSQLDEEDIKILLDEIPSGRMMQPEEIADTCLFLLSSQAACINAQVLCLDGGWRQN
ncbi:MAG: 3-oxoacyl-ACP reductase FabG [Syntrophomonadaceae bacterium]|jgi:3-oxoacyl-[acyl-carrier protein] reductase|nr:3-oxoacyl-ACP reductase FabG [Syntrophomonadaceae bacterium]